MYYSLNVYKMQLAEHQLYNNIIINNIDFFFFTFRPYIDMH